MEKHSKPVQTKPNVFRRFLNTPKGYVFLALLLLMCIAAIHRSDTAGIKSVAVAVMTALVIDFLVALIRKHKRLFSDGGLITGMMIGLILDAVTPWYMIMVTTAVAVLSKHVLKVGRKPIFNPAAFGLLVAIYVFHTAQSWWGDLADLPMWCVFILLACGYIIVHRVNKFPLLFSFLTTYVGLLILAAYLHVGHTAYSPGDALRDPIVNAALFMALFMLTDPPTSPAKYGHQIAFGAISAAVGTMIYILFGGLTYLLIGLLVANAWKTWHLRNRNPRPMTESRTSRA